MPAPTARSHNSLSQKDERNLEHGENSDRRG
jgi:hypothetical protein